MFREEEETLWFNYSIILMRRPPTFHRCQRTPPTLTGHQHNQSGLGRLTQALPTSGFGWIQINLLQASLVKWKNTQEAHAFHSCYKVFKTTFSGFFNWSLWNHTLGLHTGSHGSQGSPIPETKRCLRLVNLIGRGDPTQFLDLQLMYIASSGTQSNMAHQIFDVYFV